MKKILQTEFIRLFKNKWFYISIVIGIIIGAFLTIELLISDSKSNYEIEKYGMIQGLLYYPSTIFNSALGFNFDKSESKILYMIFPLLSVISYSYIYTLDIKTGYIKNILISVKRRDYYNSKFIVSFLSGFLTCGIILFGSLLISMCFFPCLKPEIVTANYAISEGDMFFNLFYSHPMIYLIIYYLIDMWYCGIFSVLSLAISRITNKIFVVITGSFIFFTALDYVLCSFHLVRFSPFQFLQPSQMSKMYAPFNIYIILTEAIFFTLISYIIFMWRKNNDIL